MMDFTSPIALDIYKALEIERKEQRRQNRLVDRVRHPERFEIKPIVLPSNAPTPPSGIVGA